MLGEQFDFYILDDQHKVVITHDIREWLEWTMKIENRRVALSHIGGRTVSTVMLSLFGTKDLPERRLFETMVSGGEAEDEFYKYETWDDALKGHQRIVSELGGEVA